MYCRVSRQTMQCVILAAGRGARLKPHTNEIPKPLLKLGKDTILERVLKQLPDAIDQIILVIGWKGEKVRDYFGKKFNNKNIFYVEQKEARGTGHALSICKDLLKDKFLVLMGDDVYDKNDLERCLRHDLCLLTCESENPYSAVEINKDDTLKAVLEPPHNSNSKLVNTGVYVLDKRFFNYPLIKLPSGEYGLPQTISAMAQEHKVFIERASFWLKINSREDLEKARKYFQKS